MKDLNEKELRQINGGMNDRPFGTSYEGYPSGGDKNLSWADVIDACLREYGKQLGMFGE